MLEDVVIVCISGRGGSSEPSGITKLKDRLQGYLAPLGVNPNNIFRTKWNSENDNDPFKKPTTGDINDEINSRSTNLKYLAIIGHSYGGWAACRLSNITTRVPDYIGLLDPVFGLRNSRRGEKDPQAVYIKNWYQNYAIELRNGYCDPFSIIPCYSPSAGLSCGYRDVPNSHPELVKIVMRDWDNNVDKFPCGIDPFKIEIPKVVKHTNMDDHGHLHRLICEKIYTDINNMIRNAEELQIVLTLLNKY